MTDAEVKLKPILWAAVTAALVLALATMTAFLLLRHWGVAAGGDGGARAIVETIPAPRLQTAPQLNRVLPPTPAPEIRQRLGAALPTVLRLQDADGKPVDRDALLAGGRPIVLLPAWYRCDTLCGTMAHGALEALADTGLPPSAWRLVLFSIDPNDRPADALALRGVYLKYAAWSRPAVYTAAPPDLQLLTGNAADSRSLADTIGFDWSSEPAAAAAPGFAHAEGLIVLTPSGTVSKYLFGVRFDPQVLRAALVEASDGRVGSFSERLLLACAHFDPLLGRHDEAVMLGMRALAFLVMGALLAWVWRLRRRTAKARR